MGTTKKGKYLVDNGVDFDQIMLQTTEDMIVATNQVLKANGYKVYPKGEDGKSLIEQWTLATVTTNANGYVEAQVNFPITFPLDIFYTTVEVESVNGGVAGAPAINFSATTPNRGFCWVYGFAIDAGYVANKTITLKITAKGC